MSRASIVPKLPLDTWARIMGLDPRHFNQVTTVAKPVELCSRPWKQWAWQENSQVGREDAALAILQAENDIEALIDYPLIPIWVNDERSNVAQPGIPGVINVGFADVNGYPLNIEARWKNVISGGIEAKTLIEAGATVIYSDMDGDGYFETATVIVLTTVTDPEEIAVYYPGEAARDEWEVRPLHDPITHRRSVTIAGGSATIVMAREQLVDPDLLEALNPSSVDGDVAGNFLGTVDVYRHFNDPQTQASMLWQPRPETCNCGTTGCNVCAQETQTACLTVKSNRQGIFLFSAAVWNATTQQFDKLTPTIGRSPDIMRLFYRVGNRDPAAGAIAPNLEMEWAWARAVTYLSLNYLSRPICACDNVKQLSIRMNEDLALNRSTDVGGSSYQLSDSVIGNPLGTSRGAVLAWNMVNHGDRKVGQAVKL